MTTRRAGLSLCEHALPLFGLYLPTSPRFCVSPSPSPTCSLFLSLSLRRARYLDSAASFSVAPHRSGAGFFFVPRFVPDTRRADPLPYPTLPSPSSTTSLSRVSSSRDSRIGSRSTSLRLFPSPYLSRSIYPPSSGARKHRGINPSPFRAPYLLSRTGSLVLSLSRSRRSSRSFFRRSTTSRSSLR